MRPLSVRRLSKRFSGFTAVDSIDFDVSRSEIVVIIGANGAGKSTLLKSIAGLYRPTSGHILAFGKEAYELNGPERRRLSFLGENYALYDNLTVMENMRFFSRLYGIDEYAGIAHDLLKDFDADEYAGRKVGELSRGTKQKVAICRCLLNDPELLILDEPAAFLDSSSAELLYRKLDGLARAGSAVLYATQRLEDLYRIGRKMLLIDRGRRLRFGDIDSVVKGIRNIEIEVTLVKMLDAKGLDALSRFNVRTSGNMLMAHVRHINEVPRLISIISGLGGLIINVNSLKQNISEIIKHSRVQ